MMECVEAYDFARGVAFGVGSVFMFFLAVAVSLNFYTRGVGK